MWSWKPQLRSAGSVIPENIYSMDDIVAMNITCKEGWRKITWRRRCMSVPVSIPDMTKATSVRLCWLRTEWIGKLWWHTTLGTILFGCSNTATKEMKTSWSLYPESVAREQTQQPNLLFFLSVFLPLLKHTIIIHQNDVFCISMMNILLIF